MGCMFGFWDILIFNPVFLMEKPNAGPGQARQIDEPHWLELKHGDGVLSDNEERFRGMLFQRNAKHKVVRDIDTFINQCLEWELIK